MNRITRKIIDDGAVKVYTAGDKFIDCFTMYGDPIQKLGQLEDVEEELGIDLIILIKALKNGCYVKPWTEIKHTYEIRTGSNNIDLFLLDENDNDYSLKDYGKTWALTREELLWNQF